MNQLKQLAKEMVWLTSEYQKERLYEWEKEELADEMEGIRKKVLNGGYSVDLFVQYIHEYKQLKVGEGRKWMEY